MNPAELPELFARFSEDAENFSVEREFVDASRETIGAVEDLVWPGRDANGPGRTGSHAASGGGGFVADGGAGVGIDGNIDRELAEKFSTGVEDLDAAVATIGDVDVVVCIDGDAVRGVELAWLVTRFAPGLEPIAVLVDFGDARIHVAVADVGVPGGVPRDVGNLTEHSIDGRKRRLDMPERFSAFVGSFLLAAKDHNDATFRIELDDHVGAFVGNPNVVVPIDLDGVGEGPGVEMVADLAEEFSVSGELEELRSARAVGGTGGIAAREDEDVALRIDGDAGGFTEMKVRRKLQEVGDRLETDF